MTAWTVDYLKQIDKKIGIKTKDGNIKIDGISIFVPKDSVMIDDKNKTIFTPEEWKIFKEADFMSQIYFVKSVFKGKIIDG